MTDQHPTSKPDVDTVATEKTSDGKENSGSQLSLAANYLLQGKRHMLVKDIPSALQSLADACQIFCEVNGPLCPDNAEAHFYYGKALLEQARLDLAVVDTELAGDDADGGESDEDSDEEEKGEENDSPADEKEEEKNDDNETMEEESKVDKPEEDISEPSPMSKEVLNDDEKPSTSSGNAAQSSESENPEKEEKGEEEVGNLELAWEVLEIAKMGFSSQIKSLTDKFQVAKEGSERAELMKTLTHLQKRLSETHGLLGEVATESENYSVAVEEFKMAIDIVTTAEGTDSREVAQYHFENGLALSFWKKFKEAIESFNMAKSIIQVRIDNLESKVKNKQKQTSEEDSNSNDNDEDEIKELKSLIPELDEKIADTLDAERETIAAMKEIVEEQERLSRNSPVKNPNVPAAKDISHLVKKRKKDEAESPSHTPPTKRICNDLQPLSSTSNGETSTSGPGVSVETNGGSNGAA